MVLPRYSLRWLLGLTTVCAVVSLILASTVRGDAWAIGAAVGLGSLLLLFVLHAGAFSVAWLLSQFLGAVGGVFAAPPQDAQASPFANRPPADSPPEAAP